jgi:hypothetical protein
MIRMINRLMLILLCMLLSLSAAAQTEHTRVSGEVTQNNDKRAIGYTVSLGYELRRTDSYDHDIPDECWLCSKEHPSSFGKLGFELKFFNFMNSDLLAGITIQKFNTSNSGYLDVEYRICPSWLCFTPGEIGDKLTVEHRITAISVHGGMVLRKFPRRNLIGTSFSTRLGFSYFNIKDNLTVKMDGGYITSPDNELIGFQTDIFENSENLSLLALRPSLKMELHVGRHFSLILPEIGYEIGLYQREAGGRAYKSTSDDDVLILEPFKHKINGLNAMVGVAVHF